jgi:hypothetical protein
MVRMALLECATALLPSAEVSVRPNDADTEGVEGPSTRWPRIAVCRGCG